MGHATSRWCRAVGSALLACVVSVSAVAGQSPAAPSAAPTASPEASAGIQWPPMMFAGGSADALLFTSDCGVWGRDPITLHGEGADGTTDLVVTFSEYDSEAAQWFGAVTGSFTAPNGITSAVDTAALVYYDFDSGQWMLVADRAAQIPAAACAPASPAPS